jgi:hypothetical protein
MDYSKFINLIEAQDDRNIIKKVYRKVFDIPKQLAEFYNQYEPDDVEILINDLSAVNLYPYDYLNQLQNEYKLGDKYFIFATKNSDPIAIFNGKVVAKAHGSQDSGFEILAENFDEYVCKLIENMKP